MKLGYGNQKPVIHVYYCRQMKDISCFLQLMFGMEEEGVPCFIEAHEEKTALELGYKAAESSSLDVGIGIGEDETVILHYAKLKREEPLFQINLCGDKARLRALGANAARLVKGVPFKSIPDTGETDNGESRYLSQEEMERLTAIVLSRIKDLLGIKGGVDFA